MNTPQSIPDQIQALLAPMLEEVKAIHQGRPNCYGQVSVTLDERRGLSFAATIFYSAEHDNVGGFGKTPELCIANITPRFNALPKPLSKDEEIAELQRRIDALKGVSSDA